MKKLFYGLIVIGFLLVSTACQNTSISVDESDITLDIGDTFKVDATTSDQSPIAFTSSEESIFSVSDTGLVTALAPGNATLKLSAKNALKELQVVVNDISFEDTLKLDLGEKFLVPLKNASLFTFRSDNVDVLEVDGLSLLAKELGTASLVITLKSKTSVTKNVSVSVLSIPKSLSIESLSEVGLGATLTLTVTPNPLLASNNVLWSVSDETIAKIDAKGVLTTLKGGKVTVTATQRSDSSVVATKEITILDLVLVDQTKSAGESQTYAGLEFNFGDGLFSDLNLALESIEEGATLVLFSGDYQVTEISLKNITIIGIDNAFVTSNLKVEGEGITFRGLHFKGNSSITVVNSKNIVFDTILTNELTTEKDAFLTFENTSGITVTNSNLNISNKDAIKITGSTTLSTLISKNTISNAKTALVIENSTVLEKEVFAVTRNNITNITDAFKVSLNSNSNNVYFRYNSVSDYTNKAVILNGNQEIDFTLNYWGSAVLDKTKFENVLDKYLLGHYVNSADILSENAEDPRIPAAIIINNPIEEIRIGETHKFEYTLLPYGFVSSRIDYITSAPLVAISNSSGYLTLNSTGLVTITVRSTIDNSVNAQVTFSVTTDPGIEIIPDTHLSNLIVGSTLTLETIVKPYTLKEEAVTFISSDSSVLSVDTNGNVSAVGVGKASIRALLKSDSTVYTDYYLEVFTSLSTSNLLDLLTINQQTYSEYHEWTAFGFTFNYLDKRNLSASNYYPIKTVPKNTTKMIPIFSAIRSGNKMLALPENVTSYNDKNIHWIVVHDTANTSPGAGGLSHANYLWDNTARQTELWTSWHYTMDDEELYQHIPDDERAFHAGDGSTRPGASSTYAGGGNTNGIGIETSVAQNDDTVRTWHRTAKLVAELLVKYNLPISQMKYHIDFSGKICPQTMIKANMVEYFESLVAIEYAIMKDYGDAVINIESENTEYLDNYGRVLKRSANAMTVNYRIIVTQNNETVSRDFSIYIPGSVK